MNFIKTDLAGMIIVEPRVFSDPRGFFMETFHRQRFAEAGLPAEFVQDNHSHSLGGTLRGLHYQIEHAQGKLVRCIRGEIFDVGVDLRPGSPTFGRWFGTLLSESNRRQLYIPAGMAHGFCVTSDLADVVYKCTDVYHPQHERTIVWNDPELAIRWPIDDPLLSDKDRAGKSFAQADRYAPDSL